MVLCWSFENFRRFPLLLKETTEVAKSDVQISNLDIISDNCEMTTNMCPNYRKLKVANIKKST